MNQAKPNAQTRCVVNLDGFFIKHQTIEGCSAKILKLHVDDTLASPGGWAAIKAAVLEHGQITIATTFHKPHNPARLLHGTFEWQLEADGVHGLMVSCEDVTDLWLDSKYQIQPIAVKNVTRITPIADIHTDTSSKLGHNSSNGIGVPPEKFFHMARQKFEPSAQELTVLQWLSTAKEIDTLAVKWLDRGVSVECTNLLQAGRLSDSLDLLAQTEMKWVKIYVGRHCFNSIALDRLRGSTSSASQTMLATIETMPSVWARQNKHIFQAIPGTVALLSAETGYRYLALKPEITEGRLNKPINALIDQPLRTIDEELWVPRERAIQAVLETGENEFYTYTHFWEGLLWHFQCTVAKASDTEVMTIVEDLNDPIAHWQKSWWHNRLSASVSA